MLVVTYSLCHGWQIFCGCMYYLLSKKTAYFSQVIELVEQIWFSHSGTEELLSPDLFWLQCSNMLHGRTVWGRWSDPELWWGMIYAGGAFLHMVSAVPICRYKKHLLHFFSYSECLEKPFNWPVCNHEQHSINLFPAVCDTDFLPLETNACCLVR